MRPPRPAGSVAIPAAAGRSADPEATTTAEDPRLTELIDRLAAGAAGATGPAGAAERRVLEVGCGDGARLERFAARGWRCFGVEASPAARQVAASRSDGRLHVVARPEDLLPQRFDLVLMFGVLDRQEDPDPLLLTLFARQVIDRATRLVITTIDARREAALAGLLRRFEFGQVEIRSLRPPAVAAKRARTGSAGVEPAATPWRLAEAAGSDFHEFLRERFVPGSPWRLTAYEHLSRYAFASRLAAGARVLDFGCGSGYGSAQLARVAASVVGIDVAERALDWARSLHRAPNLRFERRSDLGRDLAAGSFDLVTCFEMIEHVDGETQRETIRNLARLLAPGGTALISTPNPAFAATYGRNPYHLRELDGDELGELLRSAFRQVTVLRQWIRPSVLIGEEALPADGPVAFAAVDESGSALPPVGYLAVCSHQPGPLPEPLCLFDTTHDANFERLEIERQLNELRQERVARDEALHETRTVLERRAHELEAQAVARDRVLAETRAWLATRERDLEAEIDARDRALAETRDWLASRERDLEAEIGARDRTLAETRAWLATRERDLEAEIEARDRALVETRDWLASRERDLEAEIGARDRTLAETRAWLARRENDLQAEIEARDRELAEIRARFETRERAFAAQLQALEDDLATTRAGLSARVELAEAEAREVARALAAETTRSTGLAGQLARLEASRAWRLLRWLRLAPAAASSDRLADRADD
ncbi:MAG: methyltransferase domain-containing protein [Thermoanaerobaculia bacterium]|nr:methyltransferase domain-containing protein [Thermoanaerobaculia bacterium]